MITLILTGCKINTIECNKKEIKNEIEENNSIIIELKNNQIINMKFSSEITMPEKFLNQKDILSSNIKEQYERIEHEYNIKPDITEKISLDSNIVDDLCFSSFEIFVLVHDAEKEFNSKIVEQNIKDNLVIKNFINLILNNQLE